MPISIVFVALKYRALFVKPITPHEPFDWIGRIRSVATLGYDRRGRFVELPLSELAVSGALPPSWWRAMNDRASNLLEMALAYAQFGWAVLPLHHIENEQCSCGNLDCKSPASIPERRRALRTRRRIRPSSGVGGLSGRLQTLESRLDKSQG